MERFTAFIDDLKTTHGANLSAVILYGSAAAGDYIPQRSDHNILIVLKKIGTADLRNAHACVREWVRLGNPLPVYFSASDITNSVDVFPIEFQQMSVARRVLFGTDLLADIHISEKYLRLQTEYELRSKLLMLRRQFIPATESVSGLEQLMAESMKSFVALFRAVLVLKGLAPPVTKAAIVRMTAERLGIDAAPFDKILRIRENKSTETLSETTANLLFDQYIEQIEKVIDVVDSIDKD